MVDIFSKSKAINYIITHLFDDPYRQRFNERLEIILSLDERLEKALGYDGLTKIRKIIHRNSPERDKKELFQLQGNIALEEGEPFFAREAFDQLNDKEELIKTIELCLKKEYFFDALNAYFKVKEPRFLRAIVDGLAKEGDMGCLDYLIRGEIDWAFLKSSFNDFCEKRKLEPKVSFSRSETINAAYNLILNYDIGVGIARGGLFSSYIFNLMGLPLVLAETHRRGKGATFKWHDNPEMLKSKKILVLDKDVVSGRSVRRVVRELKQFSPAGLGLFLNHNPLDYINIKAIPPEFENIYYPKKMDYFNFYGAYIKFKENLAKQK